MSASFEGILFVVNNIVVEKQFQTKSTHITELQFNGVLKATRTITAEGTQYRLVDDVELVEVQIDVKETNVHVNTHSIQEIATAFASCICEQNYVSFPVSGGLLVDHLRAA
ncbi:hypothetical protein A141_17060 [Vibrio crassostreae ZF-91]|nr:hypothetical protein A141_17060 [Vibrio crassostreae ZF-91]